MQKASQFTKTNEDIIQDTQMKATQVEKLREQFQDALAVKIGFDDYSNLFTSSVLTFVENANEQLKKQFNLTPPPKPAVTSLETCSNTSKIKSEK